MPDIDPCLKPIDWAETHSRMTAYAAKKLSGYPALKHLRSDIVQDAIEAFLSGRRKWNPEKCSLIRMLNGTIDSLVSQYVKSWHSRNVEYGDEKVDDAVNKVVYGKDAYSNVVEMSLVMRGLPGLSDFDEMFEKLAGFMFLRHEKRARMVRFIIEDPEIKAQKLADKLGIKRSTVEYYKIMLRNDLGEFLDLHPEYSEFFPSFNNEPNKRI